MHYAQKENIKWLVNVHLEFIFHLYGRNLVEASEVAEINLFILVNPGLLKLVFLKHTEQINQEPWRCACGFSPSEE